MKILLVTHHWKPYTHHSPSSGAERIAFYLAQHHDIDLLTWKKRGSHFPDDAREPFTVRRIATPASDVFLERRLLLSWEAMQIAGQYDLVHTIYSVPAVLPSMRHPTVVTTHIIPEINSRDVWLRYKGMIQRIVFKHAARIITVSTNLYEILAERYGADRVVYIPHGIDVNVFRPGLTDITAFRQILLGDRFRLLALMVGSHGSNGDLVKRLVRAYPQIFFVIIGKQFSGIEESNISFASHISEEKLIQYYEGADIYFRPLRFATANGALLEAMAMGKAIVAHKIAGVTDYLDSASAYLAENDEDFVVQFHNAVENGEERQQKAHAARVKAEREFAWEHVCRKTEAIYAEVVG